MSLSGQIAAKTLALTVSPFDIFHTHLNQIQGQSENKAYARYPWAGARVHPRKAGSKSLREFNVLCLIYETMISHLTDDHLKAITQR